MVGLLYSVRAGNQLDSREYVRTLSIRASIAQQRRIKFQDDYDPLFHAMRSVRTEHPRHIPTMACPMASMDVLLTAAKGFACRY